MIRRAVAADQRYIAATWFHSMLGRNRAPRVRRRTNSTIDRVLDDNGTLALVATNDADRIVGWIVYAATRVGRIVYYVYVRDEERGKGLASRLIEAAWPGSDARLVLTMRGPSTAAYLDRKKNAVFIPVEEVLGS